MKLYLECAMGASGDMLMAALCELLPDRRAFFRRMADLNLPGIELRYRTVEKCGITGAHIDVTVNGESEESVDVHSHGHDHTHDHDHNHDHEHDHDHNHEQSHGESPVASLQAAQDFIRGLDLPENVKEDALAVYAILGEAEAAVHGAPVENVHFHELGTLDAMADIIGCCLLISMLGVTDVSASPVHVGSGFVRCSHGILPVPAPATARILTGVPIYGGRIDGELCTPTGAAVLKHFVTRFGDMELMTASRVGYGMGTKDFEIVNCLRAFLCEDSLGAAGERDEIFELSCNLDDMTPEAVAAAVGVLLDSGALDVFTTPVYMKKNRPAVMLTCLCSGGERIKFSHLMLKHTTTLGVRAKVCRRDILTRREETVSTRYGDIRVKYAAGYGVTKAKPEYDDVLAAAKRHGATFGEVYDAAAAADNR